MYIKWIFLLWPLFGSILLANENLPQALFPVDYKMEKRVEFWKKVFTQMNNDQGMFHDSTDLELVYSWLNLGDKNNKTRDRFIKNEQYKLINSLKEIYKKKGQKLTKTENKIFSNLGKHRLKEIPKLIKNIRFQRGMADKYIEGLKRSLKYSKLIKKIFIKEGLPEYLSYIPHVESSFNYNAYSKVGAAGIWQFLPLTAKHFRLKMNNNIDERLDPIKATKAAANLLRTNFQYLKSWPLAITAYNSGLGRISRAKIKVKTNNLSEIISNFKDKNFGFASKNFYASFVAVSDISNNLHKYFPKENWVEGDYFFRVIIKKDVRISQILDALIMKENELRSWNPSLRKIAFKNDIVLPKGIELSLPNRVQSNYEILAKKLLEKSEERIRFVDYIMQEGDDLLSISKKFNVPIHHILSFNQKLKENPVLDNGDIIKIPLNTSL